MSHAACSPRENVPMKSSVTLIVAREMLHGP